MYRRMCAAGLVLLAAGAAMGQPAVNGKLKPEYGPIQWWNTTPTSYGDAGIATAPACDPIGGGVKLTLNNSSRAGIAGGTTAADQVAAAAVSTGYELKIPLEALGLNINNNGANLPDPVVVKIAGWVGSGDYGGVSNQFIGGIGQNATLNAYPNPRSVDLSTTPGDQFVTVSIPKATLLAMVSGNEPILDGTKDASYGAPLFVQDTNTNYGDSTTPQGGTDTIFRCGGGSELDAAYAQFGRDSAGDLALYVLLAGNFESNYNKLAIFFDSIAGGQNQLTRTSATQTGTYGAIFGGGANAFLTNTTQPGLKFDAGFEADYFMGFGLGGSGDASPSLFADWQRISPSTTDAGSARYIGQDLTGIRATGSTPGVVVASDPCPPWVEPSYADYATGSEIDGVYATVCGNYLYVLVTGNLESNGNRLDLFFDVGTVSLPLPSAGQNQLKGNSHPFDYNHLNRLGTDPAAPTTAPGLTFSSGFAADYWMSFEITGNPANVTTYAGLINSLGANNDGGIPPVFYEYGSFAGGAKATNTPLVFDGQKCVRRDTLNACAPNGLGSPFNPTSIPGIDVQGDPTANGLGLVTEPYASFAPRLISQDVYNPLGINDGVHPAPAHGNLAESGLISTAIDDSNHAGVTGADATQARRVATGMEAKIRLDELGYQGSGPIRLAGFVVSQDHADVSNQVIGGALAAGQGSLGEPRTLDFNAVAGATGPFYITINPGTCASVATGGCCFDTTTCTLMSSDQCTAVGGTFYAGSCTPLPCGGSVPNGVCCRGATCSTAFATAAACTSSLPTTQPGAVHVYMSASTVCNASGNNRTPCCYANYNHNASLEVQDIFDFLNDWFAGKKTAIPGGDGATGTLAVQNIFDFLNAWFAGGCS